MSRCGTIFSLGLLLSLAGLSSMSHAELGPASAPSLDEVRFFERKIRPVLIERCYSCHSAVKVEGGLRLDTAEGLRKGGVHGRVISSDRPVSSPLLAVMRKPHPDDAELQQRPLPMSTILDVEAWIKSGAVDPRGAQQRVQRSLSSAASHWAFQPLASPTPPRAGGGVTNAIDAFVFSSLAVRQLNPEPSADRGTLFRRAAFDLTGLPPSGEEMEAFLKDVSPEAFASLIDQYLQSQRFGEHWGRLWLRTMQFAESARAGVDAVYEDAWRYRDYVINAFNEDKPFDLFVREQVAGDLMPSASPADAQTKLIATGFLVLGPKFVLDPNSRNLPLDIADEQVDLTTRVFLGLSVSCARCHDHKSDPIRMSDYYALAGIFASTQSFDLGEGRRRGAPHRLERSLATPEQLKQVNEFEKRFADLRNQLRAARERQMEFPGDVDSSGLSGVVVDNLAAEVVGAWKESNYSTNFVDKDYLHDGNSEKGKKTVRYVPDLPEAGLYEVLISYTPRANRATNVPISILCQDGLKKVFLDQTRVPTVDKCFSSVGRFRFRAGTKGSVTIGNEATKGFVIADAVRFVPEGAAKEPEQTPSVARSEPEAAFLNYRQLEKELVEMQGKRPTLPEAMAVQEGKIHDSRLGAGVSAKPGEAVPRGFLSFIPTPESTLYAVSDEGSGRLELAYWITNPDNPLTARVAVNRVWQHLFGRGIVETTDDFGTLGARPQSPELLDYLAKWFVDNGWSYKKLIRMIMLSRAYQMRSSVDEPAPTRGQIAGRLGRRDSRRLQAEEYRDALLAVAGDLDLAVGGPWADPNTILREGMAAATRAQRMSVRRSVYLPMLPSGNLPEVIRELGSDSVASASGPGKGGLAANPFLVREARTWARRLLATPGDAARLTLAFRQALSRAPSTAEIAHAEQILRSERKGERSDSETDLAAWSTVLTEILNGAEFHTIR